jgi:hypothetical protein
LPPPAARRTAFGLFALLFASYAWFHQGGGWNQNVRFAQVEALVERGTFAIDDHLLYTLELDRDGVARYRRVPLSDGAARSTRLPQTLSFDVSEHAGHLYPNKPPGLPLLALPGNLAARAVTRALGLDPDHWWALSLELYLTTLLSVGLLAAVGGVVFHDVARRLFPQAAPRSVIAASLTYGLGTPIFAFATYLIDPAVVATFSLLALRALLQAREREGAPRVRSLFAAGVFAGLGVMVNQSAALIAVALGIYAVAVHPARLQVLAYVAGGVGPALALGAYQWSCFGSPFDLPQDHQLDMFRTQAPLLGVFGVPRPALLLKLMVMPYRGLLFWSPVLAAGLAGLLLLFATRGRRPEAALFTAIFIAFWLMNASFNAWHGGSTFAPRYLVPAVPFVALPLVLAFERARRVTGAAALISVALALLVNAVDPQVGAEETRPLTRFYLPLLRGERIESHGYVLRGPVSVHPTGVVADGLEGVSGATRTARFSAFNLGELAAPESLASLAPLVLAIGAGALALERGGRADRRGPEAAPDAAQRADGGGR